MCTTFRTEPQTLYETPYIKILLVSVLFVCGTCNGDEVLYIFMNNSTQNACTRTRDNAVPSEHKSKLGRDLTRLELELRLHIKISTASASVALLNDFRMREKLCEAGILQSELHVINKDISGFKHPTL